MSRELANGRVSRRLVTTVVAVAAVLASSACGGGDESAAGSGDAVLATVNILEDAVAVQASGAAEPVPAEDGASVGQGDQVLTDQTGFAEVVFFDGSWQRVDKGTTLTLTELVDIEGSKVVRTGLDQGRAWQRVESLTTDEDSVELDTPVAVAAVRGTEYSVDCASTSQCTFAVVDGVVALTVSNGTVLPLVAGQRLTVVRDQPLGQPEDVGVEGLRSDPWIAQNLERDASDPPEPPAGGGPASQPVDEEFAAEVNAICRDAGVQSDAIVSDDNDDLVSQQADVLDDALDRLQALQAPDAVVGPYQELIDAYRQRTALVRQAVAATGEERAGLVTELLSATATGAARARELGLNECVLRAR